MENYQPNRACSCTRCRTRGIMGPAILVVLGLLLLGDNLNVPGAGFGHTWPLLLITIGLVKVLQGNASTYGHLPPPAPPAAPPPVPGPPPAGEVTHV
jgi:hypothetical protein